MNSNYYYYYYYWKLYGEFIAQSLLSQPFTQSFSGLRKNIKDYVY